MTEGQTIRFTIEGAERVLAVLRKDWSSIIQTIAHGIAESLKDRLVKEPPRNKGAVVWASETQRRWYHWARKEAGLPLPYSRNDDPWTQRLSASWAVEYEGTLGAFVGTRVTYAPYVQADAAKGGIRQQPMHHYTGWPTDAEAVQEVKDSGDIQRIAEQVIGKALSTP